METMIWQDGGYTNFGNPIHPMTSSVLIKVSPPKLGTIQKAQNMWKR